MEVRPPVPRATSPSEEDDIHIQVQTTFAASLDAKDTASCVDLLKNHFGLLAHSGSPFEWLKDSLAIGLSPSEVVSLLFEASEQSPWICYEDYSQSNSPHRSSSPTVRMSAVEVQRRIAELCGLGGVIPKNDDRALWMKNAEILEPIDQAATISYGSNLQSADDPTWVREVLDQCLDALDRLIKLFRWLQSHGLVTDHFVIFRIDSQDQIETVQVPLSVIMRLRQCVVDTNDSSTAEDSKDPDRELCAASDDFLRLIFLYHVPSELLAWPVSGCALAVQALCVSMLSFGQAHMGELDPFFLERSLSHVVLQGAPRGSTRASRFVSDKPLFFQLASLTCAGEMIDSKVMVLAERMVETDQTHDLSITPEDLTKLWGPGTLIMCQPPTLEAVSHSKWLKGIAIRGGVIYKPSKESSKMHWKSEAADDLRGGVALELSV
jgi:hypothetical protein